MTNCSNETIQALLDCHKADALREDPWPHSEKYAIFMHCLSVLSLILFCFAAYCVYFKTMNEAKFFAKLQLAHLVSATFTDLLLTSICTPIIFVPYYAGYFNGMLSVVNLDPFVQTCLCLFGLICSASSILHLLWFKTYILLPRSHWMKRDYFFTKGLFGLYPFWLLFSTWSWWSLGLGMEEQWIGSLQRMTGIPSQLYNEHASQVFLMARREKSNSFIFVNITIVSYLFLGITSFLWSMRIINRLETGSEKTKKMQRKAMIALAIQISVFFVFFSIPMVFFYFMGRATDNPVNVNYSFIGFFFIFIASIGDTSTMIALNEGYRNTFLEKTRLDRFFKRQIPLIVPISHASSIPD